MSDDIITNSGQVVGHWDGKSAQSLMLEMKRIKQELRKGGGNEKVSPEGVPHRDQLPDDLQNFTAYLIWGCDLQGNCICGVNANRIVSVDDVRRYSLIDHH